MAFSIFFSITVIVLISYVADKKKLHLFEILFMWMVIVLIDHNFITITAVNLGLFTFSGLPANYWTFVFIRLFLYPLLIIWYFDKTLAPKPYRKWAWLPVGVLVLVGIEYLADAIGVYTHARWKPWWSLIEWCVIFLLVNYSWLYYRHMFRKELN